MLADPRPNSSHNRAYFLVGPGWVFPQLKDEASDNSRRTVAPQAHMPSFFDGVCHALH